jgi:CheY-like chemotaxis protein
MRKKILLVDDTVTATMLEKLWLGAQYDYVEARDGDEAFSVARRERPDLIVMDINMPVKTGIEGLRSLKADAGTSHIPVIIVTTRSESQAEETCRSLGCADFITKPIDRDQLVNAVKRHVG